MCSYSTRDSANKQLAGPKTGKLHQEILIIMSGDPNAILQAAKKQLNECDQEIGAIRAVLRGLGTTAEHEAVNELTLEWLNPPVRRARAFARSAACVCVFVVKVFFVCIDQCRAVRMEKVMS